jgi:Flp pilus assembly protein TadB
MSHDDPIAVLRWVRRGELASAVLAVLAAVALWDTEWLRWTLLALALVGLSPWPGAAAIIRRHERTGRPPTTLSPEQRAARARRGGLAVIAYILIGSFVLATVLDGPGAGLAVAVIALICLLPSFYLLRRMTRREAER